MTTHVHMPACAHPLLVHRVELPWQGDDVLRCFAPRAALLAVRLLALSHPKPVGGGGGGSQQARAEPLFDPPLSLQRRRLVADLVRCESAACVVDVGCGDGALLHHLLCECGFGSLRRLVGVDVSARQLAAAGRKLQGLRSSWTAVHLPGDGAAGTAQQQPAADVAAGEGGSGEQAAPAPAPAGGAAALRSPAVSGLSGEGSTLTGGRAGAAAVDSAQVRRCWCCPPT